MPERTVIVDGRSEEEFRLDINRAIADTEDEIFREALGDQELDNDGDNTLEQMEEHPLDEEVEEPDLGDQEQVLEAEEAEEQPEEETEEAEGEPEGEEPPEQEPERRQGIPSYRVREEAEGRRAAEERAVALERELAQMRGRMDEMSARLNQPPQQQPQPPARPPKPDRYTDEAAYDEWMLAEGERRAEARFNTMRAQMEQDRQVQMAQRVEASFGAAANSERRYEFLDAYDRLTRLDHRDSNVRATVQGIVNSTDPAAALFDWFQGYQQPRGQPQRRAAPQREPQHEVRLPTRPPRGGPPSLNAMGGGGPGQRVDPELYDVSDAAVFRYATR